MLHHLSFGVSDLDRSSRFYDAVLGALGYVRVWSAPDAVGYGISGGGDRFAIKRRAGGGRAPGPGFHLAFAAPSPGAVDLAYGLGLQHGGLNDGPPGPRPHYGPHYYAGFLIDPDGYHVDMVINSPCAGD